MTAQTTDAGTAAAAVDEAFWDLVLSDPELVDAALSALTDPDADEPSDPGDGAGSPAGEPDRASLPWPRTPGPRAPAAPRGPGPRKAAGRVRSPPRAGNQRQRKPTGGR